jgi:hypothetical protein
MELVYTPAEEDEAGGRSVTKFPPTASSFSLELGLVEHSPIKPLLQLAL